MSFSRKIIILLCCLVKRGKNKKDNDRTRQFDFRYFRRTLASIEYTKLHGEDGDKIGIGTGFSISKHYHYQPVFGALLRYSNPPNLWLPYQIYRALGESFIGRPWRQLNDNVVFRHCSQLECSHD